MEEQEKQESNKPERDEKGRLLPGNTANPNGRPKGKTMKEFAREFLMSMGDEEKVEWLKSLGKDIVWKMAEGNPHNSEDSKVELIMPQPIIPLNVQRDNSNSKDNSTN